MKCPLSVVRHYGATCLWTQPLKLDGVGTDAKPARRVLRLVERTIDTSCSEAQLRGAGELAARYPDVWIQSHVAENLGEIAWVRELHPQVRSYLNVYERFGLLRPRAVYAHCIHIDDEDRALMRTTGAAAAVSPTSNLFLGSGFLTTPAPTEPAFSMVWPVTWAVAPPSARFTPCWRLITWAGKGTPSPACR